MQTNKWYIGISACMALFFGYLGYQAYFVDNASSASSAIAEQLQSAEPASAASQVAVANPVGTFGLKRAQIALQEYAKDVAELRHGCNCGPRIDLYNEGYQMQWCTTFASWVTMTAGSPLKNAQTGSWRISNSRALTTYLKEHGTFYTKEMVLARNLSPEIGDFVIYWRGNFEESLGHTDIVVALDSGPGTADLVGGNLKDRISYRNDFPYEKHYGFLGFGHPEK